MLDIKLPKGNGQTIYIDPEQLYIKPEWINNDLHAIFIPDISFEDSNPLYEAYKYFFKYLYEHGYKVETDSSNVDNDAFFFTPCLDKHINKTKEEYKYKKDKKIAFFLKCSGIFEPFSVSFPENSFPKVIPNFPFVLKNETNQGGKEKFIIRTKKQLEILKKFYYEVDDYSRKKRIEKAKEQYPELEFDENGYSNKGGICINFVNYKKEFHKNMRMQKFVKTPTKYYTSLRVLISSSLDILSASLKYSKPSLNYTEKYGLFDEFLSDSTSPYYLGNESIISNTVAGGNSILIGKNNYSKLEKELLLAHNLDSKNPIIPKEIEKSCIDIAKNCKREIGAICGIDFIYDDDEKKWKYLEEHEYPMLYSYAEKYNYQYNSNLIDFYQKQMLIDMKARLHSLNLYMQKQKTLNVNQVKRI